jgi:hypothetical protein
MFAIACATPALVDTSPKDDWLHMAPTWGWECLKLSFQFVWATVTHPLECTLGGLDLASLGLVNGMMLASPLLLARLSGNRGRLKLLLAALALCDVQVLRWIGASGASIGCYAWIASFLSLTAGVVLAMRSCQPAPTAETGSAPPSREKMLAEQELSRFLHGG